MRKFSDMYCMLTCVHICVDTISELFETSSCGFQICENLKLTRARKPRSALRRLINIKKTIFVVMHKRYHMKNVLQYKVFCDLSLT